MLPTDIQRKILKKVVLAFLNSGKATPRKDLVIEFQDLAAVNDLTSRAVLVQWGGAAYMPTALAFHYCGDSEVENMARRSVRIMAEVFRSQFLNDHQNLTREGMEADARNVDATADAKTVEMGLFFNTEFRFICAWKGGNVEQPAITPTQIDERIVNLKNPETLWDDYIRKNNPWPGQNPTSRVAPTHPSPGFDPIDEAQMLDEPVSLEPTPRPRRVFVVHGHNHAIRRSVEGLLAKLDLEPIVLHKQPNKGRTIIEKIEENSDVGFAVVILTPDDVGISKLQRKKRMKLRGRARQNVIMELGYFMGKLGRTSVCALHAENIELPSDIDGVLYVPYDKQRRWRAELVKEINASGIPIDPRRLSGPVL
jgi:predicted nucleotide-binding protein